MKGTEAITEVIRKHTDMFGHVKRMSRNIFSRINVEWAPPECNRRNKA